MRLRHVPLGLLLLFLTPAIPAQISAAAGQLPPNAPAIPIQLKNAPFSAKVITQYDRVLENGNHIRRETQGRVVRDSQGRVRTETELPSTAGTLDVRQHITIQDPVQRLLIHLDPRTRVATIHHLGEPALTVTAKEAVMPKPGNVLLVVPQVPPGTATAVPAQKGDSARKPVVRTEALGMKLVEGVIASGTRTTWIIESSDQPIVATTESWFSRDLQMMVLSVTNDGQSAHSTMRLTDIVRGDPSTQLFQVPADYTIKDSNPATASVKH